MGILKVGGEWSGEGFGRKNGSWSRGGVWGRR